MAAKTEARLKSSLDDIDNEVAAYRQQMMGMIDLDLAQSRQELTLTKREVELSRKTMLSLREKVEQLELQHTSQITENEQLKNENARLLAEVQAAQAQWEQLIADRVGDENKLQELHHDLSDVLAQKEHLQKEIELLKEQNNAQRTTNAQLMEKYIHDRDELNKQLAAVQTKLLRALDQLKTTQSRDDAMRKELANMMLAVEKREQVLRKRESKVLEGEMRVKEYDNYMKL